MRGRDLISEEKVIGKKYVKLLRNSFKSQISVLNKRTGRTFKVGTRVRFRDLMLQSIAVRTTHVPFINFYGVDKERKEHYFKSKSGKVLTRKEHPFKLVSKIKDLNIPTAIINGFADEIGELRGDAIIATADKQFQVK